MARLRKGEHNRRQRQVYGLLRYHWRGLREIEIAQMLGWQRRCVNNYLRKLNEQEQAYKEGRLWFAE